MAKRIELSKAQLKYLEKEYPKQNYTLAEMSEHLGVSVETIRRRASEKGLTRPKDSWTPNKIKWLKKNYNKSYKEMREYLDVCNEVIRRKINELGLTRTTIYKPFKIDPNDKDFKADLLNPRLSAPDIVEKYKDIYGIGESRIHQLRKAEGIKLQIDTTKRTSSAEKRVEEVLTATDVAFIKEKRIGRYSIDFYLGFKICLEVQGDYWHNKPKRKLADARKKKNLEAKGYKVFYIWESELDKAENIINNILSTTGFPIS